MAEENFSRWMENMGDEIGEKRIHEISMPGIAAVLVGVKCFQRVSLCLCLLLCLPTAPSRSPSPSHPTPPPPGAHNAGSYSISTSLGILPCSPAPPMFGAFFVRWSLCHSQDVYQQLKAGCRYIDLRVCVSHIDQELRTEHTVYGERTKVVLEQIRRFLR